MPRRSSVSLLDVASLDTLAAAFGQAARGKRLRADVQRFAGRLDEELTRLRDDILLGRAPDGEWISFGIRDPKPRRILAPCFRDRVLHHALMGSMSASHGAARTGSNRVIRGGSWNSNARNVRAANRNANLPENRNANLGFRLAREQERVGGPAPDPSCAASGPPWAGESQAGAGVGVGAADAPSKPRRQSTYGRGRHP